MLSGETVAHSVVVAFKWSTFILRSLLEMGHRDFGNGASNVAMWRWFGAGRVYEPEKGIPNRLFKV